MRRPPLAAFMIFAPVLGALLLILSLFRQGTADDDARRQLAEENASLRANVERNERAVEALQRQVRALGEEPVEPPPSASESPTEPSPAPSPTPSPSRNPRRPPRPSPRPSPSPSPTPPLCILGRCIEA